LMVLSGGSGRLWSYTANWQRYAGLRRMLARAVRDYWPILPRSSSPVVAIAARWMLAAAIIAITLAAAPFQLDAAVITGSTLKRQNDVAELHFIIKGRGLGWRLTTHGQEIWIDLSHVRMELPPRPLLGAEQSPIASVRTIDDGGGTARIVVQVIGRVDYAIARIPHQLVLRVASSGASDDLAAPFVARTECYSRRPRPAPANETPIPEAQSAAIRAASGSLSASAYSRPIAEPASYHSQVAAAVIAGATAAAMLPIPSKGTELASYSVVRHSGPPLASPGALPSPVMDNNREPLVVIDPGHGGQDPGTTASDGTAEKEVALTIASRLCAALKAEGIRAEMTRSDDIFLSLPERTAIANQADADLFVSIHLNSSPDTATNGIETYYLNNTTDHATIRLARMENGVAGGYGLYGGPNLNYILTDMRQQYKANESASLAAMIETEAAASVSASTGMQLNALGAKQGPFYVLVGAMMPAVLVECGFLSNPNEAQLLETPRYQQALADGIARAVAHYLNTGADVGNL
jgi:N-acetylmuramoyl-L-alanine amidase